MYVCCNGALILLHNTELFHQFFNDRNVTCSYAIQLDAFYPAFNHLTLLLKSVAETLLHIHQMSTQLVCINIGVALCADPPP